jgi:hypothetical protein
MTAVVAASPTETVAAATEGVLSNAVAPAAATTVTPGAAPESLLRPTESLKPCNVFSMGSNADEMALIVSWDPAATFVPIVEPMVAVTDPMLDTVEPTASTAVFTDDETTFPVELKASVTAVGTACGSALTTVLDTLDTRVGTSLRAGKPGITRRLG